MSTTVEIKIPDIGNVHDVDVVAVEIQTGDVITIDQTLITLETDKASMDVPTTVGGTVQQVHIKVGDKVNEGSLMVTVLVNDEVAPVVEVTPAPVVAEVKSVEIAPIEKSAVPAVIEQSTSIVAKGKAHASPAVRLFARELGVDISQIVQGGGRKNRILKEDVKSYIKKAMTEGITVKGGSTLPKIAVPDFSVFGEIETQPLSKINKLTGQHMTSVWLNLPMVTYHDDADITEMEAFRVSLNSQKNVDVKFTGLLFIIKALAAAMQQFPRFNSSLSSDGESLILKKYLNIGIAVDTPNGLVVPVLRDVPNKSLKQLAAELGEKSEKARAGKLTAADMQGGCMSISSLGGIGGKSFTPIVNAPEVAILGVTKSSIQPVWNGKEFEPRLILPLDLTYDHRVIDGAEGARFMEALKYYLNDVRRLLV
ncbi:MAG: branched-chain alpha-keto acid dehydrogenase subunit E2 [Methylococcaceae bacterium]|nr:branched-chain alpha-keto acid dehydrogenase subunit E2 [Methylococcaceae bacterium]